MAPDLGIIADDLSGASDTGLQFAKRGLRTVVLFEHPAEPPAAAVVVLDTDSRQAQPTEAARRVRSAARTLLALGIRAVYKKVDSTLRGNIGAEIDALLDEVGAAGALVAPAFPSNGRTVVGGRLLLRGVPLEETEFARDPLWPARCSRVASVVARQSRRRVGEVSIEVVRRGRDAVTAEAGRLRAVGAGIAVVDAETPADLAEIARAVACLGGRWVPVGSAGLAEELPEALSLTSGASAAGPPSHPSAEVCASSAPGGGEGAPPASTLTPTLSQGERVAGSGLPALVVVGSVNPVARRQLQALVDSGGLTCVTLGTLPLLAGGAEATAEVGRAAEELRAALRSGSDAALVLEVGADGSELLAGAAALGLDRAEASARLASSLGRVVALVVGEGVGLAGLAMTGGDTAKGVCLALGGHGVVVEREVLPGIPQGRLLGGAAAGLPLVTKAGGFGGPDALVEAMRFLRRM